jgi:hypothetical protein
VSNTRFPIRKTIGRDPDWQTFSLLVYGPATICLAMELSATGMDRRFPVPDLDP